MIALVAAIVDTLSNGLDDSYLNTIPPSQVSSGVPLSIVKTRHISF